MHEENEEMNRRNAEEQTIAARLSAIRRRVIVLSGKGGVGKSTIAVHVAAALSRDGHRTGLLDVDIHGPSVPAMLGLEGETPAPLGEEMLPVPAEGLKVMSIGFLLNHPDDAVIWRGPMKTAVITQFLRDVAWGELDYLIVDSPPGTGDELLTVCQKLGRVDGAIVVTTPQRVAALDVRKSITFCRRLGVPILGVVENMSGFVCPRCGERSEILLSGGGRKMADEMGVAFLGCVPIDPDIARDGDRGVPFFRDHGGSVTAETLRRIIQPIERLDDPAFAGALQAERDAALARLEERT